MKDTVSRVGVGLGVLAAGVAISAKVMLGLLGPHGQSAVRLASASQVAQTLADAPKESGEQPNALSPADLFKRISPSVARIVSYDEKSQMLGQGSGFVATSSGLVVTNYHVVKGAKSLRVFVGGNSQLQTVGIAALDRDGDLALVQVKGPLPTPLEIAGALPAVGERTYAIGNPLGLTNTLSEGLVSGIRKDSDTLTLVQTTAAISHGSSGGPLVNEAGRVLGVTTLCYTDGQNLNFAVESSRIRNLISKYNGSITRVDKQKWLPTLSEERHRHVTSLPTIQR